MVYFFQELILTAVLLVVTMRLLSKKHCVENFSVILYTMLFYLVATYMQVVGMDMEKAQVFCISALFVGGILMCWFSFGKRRIYWVKGLNRYDGESMLGLAELVKEYIEENGLNGRVAFDYSRLSLDGVSQEQEKRLVRLMNDFINEHDCMEYKWWRKLVYGVFAVQILCLGWQSIFYILF